MSDDHSHRPHRSTDSIARTGQGRAATPTGNDPLAELARLIGQSDPFGDAMNATARLAESAGAPPAVDWSAPSTQPQQSFAPDRTQEFAFTPTVPPTRSAGQSAQPAAAPTYAQPADPGLYEVEAAVPSYLTARGPAPSIEPPAYHPAEEYGAGQQDYYDDVPPPRRRLGVLAVAALFGLAVVGTAGAFGYRAVFGGSGEHVPPVIKADSGPLKIVPNQAEAKKAPAAAGSEAAERVVPREEKPVDVSQKFAAAAAPPPMQAVQPPSASLGNGVLSNEPRKVHTIVIRPDGSEAQRPLASPMPPAAATPQPAALPTVAAVPAPRPAAAAHQPAALANVAAVPAPAPKPVAPSPAPAPAPRVQASANAPLSLDPNAAPRSRAPVRTASAGPTSLAAAEPAAPTRHAAGAYAVQVSSQRSESEARSAYAALQGKYGKVLGGRPMFVHKVELGAKGTYYRTLVGPFASASEATELCSSLKSAGGNCLIQRN